ncbi:hypothetical protein [Kitasatospora sp. NPDC088779]|uniref:hypothetical protein n=1 Tax=Kitasatospora sp. NPDC088779 TaxID=3154964 RepID=UPI0034223064
MTKTQARAKAPNEALARLVAETGASRKSLAYRLNRLCEQAGHPRSYTHGSWTFPVKFLCSDFSPL